MELTTLVVVILIVEALLDASILLVRVLFLLALIVTTLKNVPLDRSIVRIQMEI